MLSPATPVSLLQFNATADGAGGATVSTENANGPTPSPAPGASSVTVNVCSPSAHATVVRIHTFPSPPDLNVPIETPSIEIASDDNPPSPDNKNDGVALALAVGSDPTCKFCPHTPLSNCT